MSSETEPVRDADVERAIETVQGAESRAALAALAYDVLSRQAEGRTFFAGEKFAQKRAEEHGVDADAAQTDAGNLLSILERGARERLERALVVAFAVVGFSDALRDDAEADARIWRFVRHADWLEVSTPYSVFSFLDGLLSEPDAERVWREVAQAVVDDAAGRDGERPEVRARNAARLTALAASESKSAAAALREVIRSTALDEPTRLLASTLAGDGDEPARAVTPRVAGRVGRAPRRAPIEVLRWISGWALAAWALRGLAFLLGMRRQVELRLADGRLEVRTELSLMGRTVRQGNESWGLDAVEGVGREVRYPSLHLLVGAVALSVGVLFGGLVLFDGVRSGELVLLALAAALILGGSALDLALDVLLPGARGRVVMDVTSRARRPLRLTRVPIEEADVFLRAVRASAQRR